MPQCQFLFSIVFLFQVFTEGNILEIGQNKSRSSYLSDTKTESKGETEKSIEPATPGGGTWAHRAPTDLSLSPINLLHRENPKGPSLRPRKVL
jgi:hypothetical protein